MELASFAIAELFPEQPSRRGIQASVMPDFVDVHAREQLPNLLELWCLLEGITPVLDLRVARKEELLS